MDNKMDTALVRGVETILPSPDKLKERLLDGKKLRIYCGYDPTGETLHLGHLFTLLKLADFQALGHEIIILIGDFTGMIGDPTDKSETRRQLTREEVLHNASGYKAIAEKFITFSGDNPATIKYNSQWLDNISFRSLIEIASNFTVQQMLAREMFQERIKRKKPIYLHEFFYPLAQGYDSVAMEIDLEVGGKDQLFNMLCGRSLVKEILKKEKFVLGTKLLTDASGKKMGKTEGVMVALTESPDMIYGKIMSWPDEIVPIGIEGCTRLPIDKIDDPLKSKSILAKEIVSICHSRQEAEEAEAEFNRVFRERKNPSSIPEIKIDEGDYSLLELITALKLSPSKSQSRRVISQGGVKIDEVVKDDWQELIPVKKGMIIVFGKRKFIKIV